MAMVIWYRPVVLCRLRSGAGTGGRSPEPKFARTQHWYRLLVPDEGNPTHLHSLVSLASARLALPNLFSPHCWSLMSWLRHEVKYYYLKRSIISLQIDLIFRFVSFSKGRSWSWDLLTEISLSKFDPNFFLVISLPSAFLHSLYFFLPSALWWFRPSTKLHCHFLN